MDKSPLWVFGYASLIWNPGFNVAERQIARLEGYARSFCMWSIHHRGTPQEPGLVLALDVAPGHHCTGVAFRVPDAERAETLAYLRERELVSSAYLERAVQVQLADGRTVEALTFIVDAAHPQYTGPLSPERQAEVIARAHGGRGPNTEYLYNTADHLAELGIEDDELTALAARLRRG